MYERTTDTMSDEIGYPPHTFSHTTNALHRAGNRQARGGVARMLVAVVLSLMAAAANADAQHWKKIDSIPGDAETTFAYLPIYSQAVMVAIPKGWKAAHEEARGPNYIFEAIPDGESLEAWTEMLTVQGFKGLARNPQATPEALTKSLARMVVNSCGRNTTFESLGHTTVDTFDAYAAIIGCAALPQSVSGAREGQGEIAYYLVVKGREDLYLIHRAIRGPAFDTNAPPISSDNAGRIEASLQPVKLCDRDEPKPACWERESRRP